jgi:hypothetical protein
MDLKRYWNGRFGGLPCGVFRIVRGAWNRLRSSSASILSLHNLGSHGKKCFIGRDVVFMYPGRIHLGNRTSVGDNTLFFTESANGECRIADDVVINRRCQLDFSGGLYIGSGCVVSEEVEIETHSHGYDPHAEPSCSALTVGSNVWIGFRSIILPQVKFIGDNSIISAGAVVTHDVPPDVIVAGVPAKVVKRIIR